jgi:hypothetical protein
MDNEGLGTRFPDQPLMASNIGEAQIICQKLRNRQRFRDRDGFRIALRNLGDNFHRLLSMMAE